MDAALMRSIGEAVRRRREAMRVSQEKFADDIKMHRAYYGGIERGEKNLQIVTLKKVCKGLGAPIWQVLRDAENS